MVDRIEKALGWLALRAFGIGLLLALVAWANEEMVVKRTR